MPLTTREIRGPHPGPSDEVNVQQVREWICLECSYFEEAEADEK